ncbi:MAG: exodeoxyribonuclease I [Gammaproteobacteria bacterium]|nr:exodeoxyribonuclease I [Gammaproteobacteria bacterium]
MATGTTLYWHDYETFGVDPRRDRPVQFAGLRTGEDLEVVGDPLELYCRPTDDYVPHPEACLITGITPQRALEQGVSEREFITRIHHELARPGTCGVGYNSMRFDDEVTRHTLYRNLMDPYGREWKNGNSRWDIIDMVRLTYALRPAGIQWPRREDGHPSFRLEGLTAANDIPHGAAHDALADVRATVALARLVKARQPRLYDYVYGHRSKQAVARLLVPGSGEPVLHTSARYPAATGCTTAVLPLAWHPTNRNGVVVCDLRHDPQQVITADETALREWLFSTADHLPAGVARPPLKVVLINHAPVVVPLNTLDGVAAERIGLDHATIARHAAALGEAGDLTARMHRVFQRIEPPSPQDPEVALYSGGFIGDGDRRALDVLLAGPPEALADIPTFADERLEELVFRFRARNHPETLDADERRCWEQYRRRRLLSPEAGTGLGLEDYFATIERLESERTDAASRQVLAALKEYGEAMRAGLGSS